MKRVSLVLLVACGAPAAAPAPAPAPPVASVAPVAPSASAAPAAPAASAFEFQPSGDPPRTITLKASGETELSLGDTAKNERWNLQWVSGDTELLKFGGSWGSFDDSARKYSVGATVLLSRTSFEQEHFGQHVKVTVTRFPTVAKPSVALEVAETDDAREAKFGQELRDDGFYRFSDGLRIDYHYTSECEYDPGTPCVEYHYVNTYYPKAKKAPSSANLVTPKQISKCELGHGFSISHRKLVVKPTCGP